MEYDLEKVGSLMDMAKAPCIIAKELINKLYNACNNYAEQASVAQNNDIDIKLSITVEQQEELERLFNIFDDLSVPAYTHKGIFELIQTVTESLELAAIELGNDITAIKQNNEEWVEHEEIEKQLVQS
jgi:hypothetical protein